MADETPRLNLGTYEQGDENWSHTDTVEAVDEHAIARGPIEDRPDQGEYDDELYYAVDQRVLWRWDEGESDWQIGGGTGSADQPLDMVHTEQARITDDEHITVNVPSDYDTVHEAFQEESKRKVPHGTRIIINIESGHKLTEGLKLTNGDYSHMVLVAEDNTVEVEDGLTPTVTAGNGLFEFNLSCIGPRIGGFIIDCKGEVPGLDIRGRSNAQIDTGGGFINADGTNLAVKHASGPVAAHNTVWTGGTGQFNVRVFEGCVINLDGADVSNSEQVGLRADLGAVVNFENGVADNCGTHGIEAVHGGDINAKGASIQGCDDDGVVARTTSEINVAGGAIKNNSGRGARARGGGEITLITAECVDNTSWDIDVDGGAIIRAQLCETTDSTGNNPHEDDVSTTGFDEDDGIVFGDFETA